jgi:predicted RNase H-like nuclease (RuvC/YqgF family)
MSAAVLKDNTLRRKEEEAEQLKRDIASLEKKLKATKVEIESLRNVKKKSKGARKVS